jgi:hypothetical protein
LRCEHVIPSEYVVDGYLVVRPRRAKDPDDERLQILVRGQVVVMWAISNTADYAHVERSRAVANTTSAGPGRRLAPATDPIPVTDRAVGCRFLSHVGGAGAAYPRPDLPVGRNDCMIRFHLGFIRQVRALRTPLSGVLDAAPLEGEDLAGMITIEVADLAFRARGH